MYRVKKYSPEDKKLWNTFVAASKNGTFLFHRDFMEYHADRFEDFSLLVHDQNEKIIAALPANQKADQLYSHQGLTYGSLILPFNISGQKVRDIVYALLGFLEKEGLKTWICKSIPLFYHSQPSFEFLYFLREAGGKLTLQHFNLGIDYSKTYKFHKTKRKHLKKAESFELIIKNENNFSDFWNLVLIPRLESNYQTHPVHTLAEIQHLHQLFPDHISQFNVYLEQKILAGITIFKTDKVAKSQYGAVTEEGKKFFALDYLFAHLINHFEKENFDFFEMGTVTDHNYGLLKQKEELGCQIYTQDFFEIEIPAPNKDCLLKSM